MGAGEEGKGGVWEILPQTFEKEEKQAIHIVPIYTTDTNTAQ
jgi:hypothetical protein